MTLIRKKTLKPRKIPIQMRSTVTMEAIYDAAIQVLLKVGVKHITTTRVAERAGVSVGTLYQYHPNIQSLMAAVLERHLNYVVEVVTVACENHHHQPLDVMTKTMVNAFIASKTAHPDISKALHAVDSDLNCADIVKRAITKSVYAVQAMLETATDYKIKDVSTVSTIILSAKIGLVRATLEAGATPQMIEKLRYHLILLCSGYLKQVAISKRR